MITVAQFHLIKHCIEREGLSQRETAQKFGISRKASRKRLIRAYLHTKQEAFLDGFVHGFRHFGGVPAIGLFDNLKTAVSKILQGRDRLEQEAFQALQAHYVFKAEFCNVEAGNEKGLVEGLVGDSRRNALVPVPRVQSLGELNKLLLDWCERSAQQKKVPYTQETIHEAWLKEKQALHPLPATPYEACKTAECRVSKIATVTFDRNQYSVPCGHVSQAPNIRFSPKAQWRRSPWVPMDILVR